MRHFSIKLITFFKKEHIWKYLAQVSLFLIALLIFFFFAAEDVISNMIGAIVGFLFSTMLLYIFKVVLSRFEDTLKVSCDTDYILNIYKGDPNYRKTLCLGGTEVHFAYADTFVNDKEHTFTVIDSPDKNFVPDEFVMNHYFEIFSAHTNSVKFNGKTIRLDDFRTENGQCTFYLSRSTVFNHLVTNRAADFSLFEDISIRDVLEYGPTISSYADSKMSNHIGINGLVFLSDGRLLIPRRDASSTISKNQVTSSIAVKLDPPKNTGYDQEITTEHLLYGNIIENLTARVKIPEEALLPQRIEVRFLGFGQNLYEAGKPQFYYSVHLHDIDTQTYMKLTQDKKSNSRIDVDKCIYVADYDSFRFHRDTVSFDIITKENKKKTVKVHYELSYLCNLWHYERLKDPKYLDKQKTFTTPRENSYQKIK